MIVNWCIAVWQSVTGGWCTMWPETWRGVYIGDPCCKNHDLTLSTHGFAKCLYTKFRTKLSVRESRFWTIWITGGASIACWVRCPIKMMRRV